MTSLLRCLRRRCGCDRSPGWGTLTPREAGHGGSGSAGWGSPRLPMAVSSLCLHTRGGELSGACFERSLVPFKRTDRLPKGPLLPPTPWGPDLPYKAWGTQRKETCDSERDPSPKGPTTRRWARADGGLRLRWRGRRRPRVCSPWLAGDRYGASVTREGNRQTRRDTSGPSRALGLVGSLLAGGIQGFREHLSHG